MNFFGNKKISEENKNLLEICKSKEKAINMLTELTQTLKYENTELNKQLTEQLHIVDDLTATNNHISALYEKLKEKYKKLEDEKDIVSVNELIFMNDNLRKERDELLFDKDKLINELAIYKSMFGHIQEIVKDYGNAILEVKKFNPYKIEDDEDEEETVCFDEPTFAKIIKSYCDAKEDSLEEVDNPILDGPYSDVW